MTVYLIFAVFLAALSLRIYILWTGKLQSWGMTATGIGLISGIISCIALDGIWQ